MRYLLMSIGAFDEAAVGADVQNQVVGSAADGFVSASDNGLIESVVNHFMAGNDHGASGGGIRIVRGEQN